MNIKGQFTLRSFVVCLIAVGVAWLLTSIVWGATCGLVGGLSIANNPEFQQEIESVMADKGITSADSRAEAHQEYKSLSEEDKQELEDMTKEAMANVNWFAVTIFVSIVIFSITGFLGGFIARAWLLAGAVPALSFLTNNLVIRFPMAKDLPTLQKVIVVVFAQLSVCYILAYLGAKLGLKRQQKKELANKLSEPT